MALIGGAGGGGSNEHITLTAEFCGTKKCRGGGGENYRLEENRRETGGVSDSSVHRLTRFCVLTHPRDRWEIKRRRKQRMSSRFWTGRSSYCTFLCSGGEKCNKRHLCKLERRDGNQESRCIGPLEATLRKALQLREPACVQGATTRCESPEERPPAVLIQK